MSAAFLTAPKLLEVFCDKTVRLCEPAFRVSFNLFVLSLIKLNTNYETIEATKLQLLTKDSMEQQRSADGEQVGL